MIDIRPGSWPDVVRPGSWPAVLALCFTACVSTTSYERDVRMRAPDHAMARIAGRVPAAPRIDGTLGGYIDHALRQNPGLHAAYQDWRAAVYAVSGPRRLPEPMVSYGVGMTGAESPHEQRIGVSQLVPWPRKRSAAAEAAADMADSAEQTLQAEALAVIRRVADAYWRLWTVQRMRDIEREQRTILLGLAELVRTRLAVGKADMADAARVDLELARRDDALATLDEDEHRAWAALRLAIGAAAEVALPIAAEPPAALVPAEDIAALRLTARAHPRVTALASMAAARDDEARAAHAQNLPDVLLGLSYIAESAMHGVPGTNMIMVSVGVTVPLWRSAYRDAERKAMAEAASLRAQQRDAELTAEAELDATLAEVRDAARRIDTCERTLIPQAELAYEAVLGSYQIGGASMTDILSAQQSAMELRLTLVTARARHARAWARLIEIIGRPVAARVWTPVQNSSPAPRETTP